jgi:glycosyltransferase involved in cell wall biosynthesis
MARIRILRFSHDYILNTGGLMAHLRGLNSALAEGDGQQFEIHQAFLTGEIELRELLSRGRILRAGASYVQRDAPVNLYPIQVPSLGFGRPDMNSNESLIAFRTQIDTLLDLVRPHIVHSHFVNHRLQLAAVEAAKAKGVATVITHHEGEPDVEWKLNFLCRAANIANRRTAISQHSAKSVPGDIDFIDFFVDTCFWTETRMKNSELDYWAKTWGISKTDLLIVYPARFVPRKNHTSLIRAFESLLTDPEVAYLRPKLVLPGPTNDANSEYGQQLRNLAFESAGNAIIFPGDQPPQLLRALYSISDIICYPSFNEGAGRSHLEGMLLGCCPVVSNDAGLNEYVIHGVNGLCFDPMDISSLCSCLRKVVLDPKYRTQLSSEGQVTASKLSLQNYASRFANLYIGLYKEIFGAEAESVHVGSLAVARDSNLL